MRCWREELSDALQWIAAEKMQNDAAGSTPLPLRSKSVSHLSVRETLI